MTSITSAASSQLTSPLSLLLNELSSEVSSGKISSADESALSSALKDIDTALKSQSSSGSSAGDVKSKIDDLIDAEVKDGKLTSDQASELKNVFAQAFGSADSTGTATDADATSGGSAASSGGSSSTTTSTDPADANKDGVVTAAERAAYDAKTGKAASGSSDTGSGSSDVSDLLRDFLAILRSSTDSSSSYAANGQKNAASQSASQVVNYQA